MNERTLLNWLWVLIILCLIQSGFLITVSVALIRTPLICG